ncbi:SDR family NAD(P)-dependent oxidoreductase [Sorangium sp. So ce341]|uniref:SDR family NAD(P)-dependent oxidoreductase n=1 Tax=Sorangium sp. So ce341 TaxID=3133302 RepID=UPI003F60918F
MAPPVKRVCLLTGAGGRLGSAFCRSLAARFDIAAVYRSRHPDAPSQLEWRRDPLRPAARVPENDGAVFAIQADLSEEGAPARVVDLALARFGRIDLLVNAAADVTFWGPLLEAERLKERLRAQIELNVMVPVRLSALVAERFWRDRRDENAASSRNVVNVSSTSGLQIYGGCDQSMYSASKAALNYITCHMADEFAAFGVRANAIAPTSFPGQIPTERVVAAIAGLDGSDVTGKVLVIDEHGERLTP